MNALIRGVISLQGVAFKLYSSVTGIACQILPILEYASDIWYTGDSVNDLEKIHLKFIKSTLGVRNKHPLLQFMVTQDGFH